MLGGKWWIGEDIGTELDGRPFALPVLPSTDAQDCWLTLGAAGIGCLGVPCIQRCADPHDLITTTHSLDFGDMTCFAQLAPSL